ncbi:MAG: hypothetical protein EOO60_10955 [Hymenobacter sp.]|nr:MAG: hypothetical protein EOO60_10955 [Hymenobacter sp.]
MFLNTNTDPRDHSSCSLFYDELDHWLCATWRGYIDPTEALQGAEAYLHHAAHTPSALLLNDNSQLEGPWFESTDWLARIWLPQAARLGLRYVAHVVQTDRQYDAITLLKPTKLPFDLQIFNELDEAKHWLRECRRGLLNLGMTG